VPSPDVNQENNYLFSVDGTSSTDAWAVGFFDTGFELRTMTQHWDGTAWTIVSSPNASTVIDEPSDVAAISPTDTWAVGQSFGFFTFNTLAMHRTSSCTSSTMHVASIVPKAARSQVQATVTITDSANAPVSGAAVTVVITKPGGSQATLTRTTNAQGRATFSTALAGSGTYTFAVTAVLKTGLTYDPTANVETSDSVTVP
jgi:hypothetical protein